MTNVRTTALIVATALLMLTLDGSVVAIALPRLARELHIQPGEMSLVVTTYMVAVIAFLPVSAWAGARFGTKRLFLSAIAMFAVFSTVSATAHSFGVLLASRFCQGACGAMLSPVGRTLLLRGVRSEDLLTAITWMTTPAVIGPIIGPPLGGVITDLLGWRYVFWLNVPIALVGLVMVAWKIRPVHEDEPHPADLVGMALSATTLALVVVGLELLSRSWSAPALLCAGAVVAALTLRHFRKVSHPAFDLSLLRYPGVRCSASGGMVIRVGAGAIPFMIPVMLQLSLGLSASLAGLLYLFAALGSLGVRTVLAVLLRTLTMRQLMVWSSLAFAAALGTFGLIDRAWPLWTVAAMILMIGIGRSLAFTSLGALAFLDVPASEMGAAASLYGLIQQLPQVVGVASASLMLSVFGAMEVDHALPVSRFALTFAAMGMSPLAAAWLFSRYPADFGSGLNKRGAG
jgi:MFS family permease